MARRARIDLSPADIPRAILRRKVVFLLVFATVAAAAVAVAVTIKFRYESGFQLLVRPGARESFSVEDASLRGDPMSDRGGNTTYANAVAILQSTDLVDRLVARLQEGGGLDLGVSPEDAATHGSAAVNKVLDWFRKHLQPPEYSQSSESEQGAFLAELRRQLAAAIDVVPIHGTTVLQVTVRWSDPVVAFRITSMLVDVCRQHYSEAYGSNEDIEFLEKLVTSTQAKLEKVIEKQESLRLEAGVSDIEKEMGLLLDQIDGLTQQFTECHVTEAATKGQVESLRHKLETTSADLPGETSLALNPRSEYLYNQLLALQLRKLESPLVNRDNLQIDLQIRRIEEEIERENKWIEAKRPGPINPVHTSLLQEIHKLDAEAIGIRTKCDTILSETQRLQARYNVLRLKYPLLKETALERDLHEADLAKWKRSLETARRADQLAQGQISNLKVIQRPEFQSAPVKNRRPLVLGLGLLGALATAALACLLLFLRYAEVGNAEQLRVTTGLTVLASIPQYSAWHCLLPGRFRRREA